MIGNATLLSQARFGEVQTLPLHNFLCEAKQYFESMNDLDLSNAVNIELIRLDKIAEEFKQGKLAFMHQKFVVMSNAFKDKACSEISARDLRFLRAKLERFDKFVKNYSMQLSSDEVVLLEDIMHLIAFLQEQLLNDDIFGIDAVDNFIDAALVRPFEWGKKNPELLVTGVLGAGLILAGARFIGGGGNPADTSIGSNGFYIPTPMHIEGIPDNICFEVSIEKQHHWDCLPASLAYLCQRADNIPDTQTHEYRHQRYVEWGIEQYLVSQIYSWDSTNIQLQKNDQFNYIYAYNPIHNSRRLLDQRFCKSMQSHQIIFLHYEQSFYSFKKDVTTNGLDAQVQHLMEYDLTKNLLAKIHAFKTNTCDRALFWFRDANIPGIPHIVGYEVRKAENEYGFEIVCYDSIHNMGCKWRRRGAAFLFKLFSSAKSTDFEICKEFLEDNNPILLYP